MAQAASRGKGHRFCLAVDVELAEDPHEMGADGSGSDEEAVSDFCAVMTAGKELEHLSLSSREGIESVEICSGCPSAMYDVAEQGSEHDGWDDRVALPDGSDSVGDFFERRSNGDIAERTRLERDDHALRVIFTDDEDVRLARMYRNLISTVWLIEPHNGYICFARADADVRLGVQVGGQRRTECRIAQIHPHPIAPHLPLPRAGRLVSLIGRLLNGWRGCG
jgi:hypothetical protein